MADRLIHQAREDSDEVTCHADELEASDHDHRLDPPSRVAGDRLPQCVHNDLAEIKRFQNVLGLPTQKRNRPDRVNDEHGVQPDQGEHVVENEEQEDRCGDPTPVTVHVLDLWKPAVLGERQMREDVRFSTSLNWTHLTYSFAARWLDP